MRWMLVSVLSLIMSLEVLGNTLEEMTDTELEKLVHQEKYVVVLFGADDGKSEQLEIELASIREDLVDSINAWVVKAENSKLKKLYTPATQPTIVFFRDRFPVIYDGPVNDEEMLEILMRYKEQCSQDLTDTSFEHLTQAATGATTGDWLVHFFKDECEACNLLTARFETVACKHRGRVNLARVNKGTTGGATGRRFGVTTLPALIFFRLGRMYRYESDKLDVDSISSFVTVGYKNAKSESIPLPKTPFDDFVQLCADHVREYPFLFALLVAIPVLVAVLFYFLMSESDDGHKKKSKKVKSSKKMESAARKKDS